ncbi:MAG: hypothetical protein C0173_06670, partial [Desulfurella sp.]|uniref:hypothetical protein n=1 Tax=Desulfurella sp. TaxID=1962857 RepID=UPI000CC80639
MDGQKTTLGAVITLIGSVVGVLGYTLDPHYIYLASVISIAIIGVGAAIIGYFAPDAQKKIIDGLTFAEKLNQVAKTSPNPI